jgi:hypothetical protein
MGLQIPCGVHSQAPQEGAVRGTETVYGRCVSQVGFAEGKPDRGRPPHAGSCAHDDYRSRRNTRCRNPPLSPDTSEASGTWPRCRYAPRQRIARFQHATDARPADAERRRWPLALRPWAFSARKGSEVCATVGYPAVRRRCRMPPFSLRCTGRHDPNGNRADFLV